MEPITIDRVRVVSYARKKKAVKDDLYKEIVAMRSKFLEYQLDEADPWSWKIMNDFLGCMNYGIYYKAQRAKVVEVLLKYGEDTIFWKELQRTDRQRKREMERIAHVARNIPDRLTQGGMKKAERSALSFFYRLVIDLRKKLLINPLSLKQRRLLWKAERILGIYYEDLSPEENGEVWLQLKEGEEDE